MTVSPAIAAAVVLAGMTDAQKTNPAPTWEKIMNYIWSTFAQTTLGNELFNKFSPAADTSLEPQDVNGIGAALIAVEATNAPDLESVGTIVLTYPYVRGGTNAPNQLDLYPY